MSQVKVFTTSWGQLEAMYSNLGDIVIFEAIIEMLKSIPSVSTIFCYSSNVVYTNKKYGVCSDNPFAFSGLIRIIHNIAKSDLVLLGGGELIQTKSSLLYLVANLAPGFLAWILRKRCLAIGVGIADREEISKVGKHVTRLVLNRIDKVCVRDTASYQNALCLGLARHKLALAADLSFHHVCIDNNHPPATGTVLFCPRFTQARKGNVLPASIVKHMNIQEYSRAFDDSATTFAHLLRRIASEYKVIILPCYMGKRYSSDDMLFAETIHQLAGSPHNVSIHTSPVDSKSVFTIFHQTSVTIGVPLHSLILTSIVNHPVIAISYSSKCTNFMTELGLERYVVDISGASEEASFDNIMHLLEDVKATKTILSMIDKKLKALRERNEVNYSAIKEFIEQEGTAARPEPPCNK